MSRILIPGEVTCRGSKGPGARAHVMLRERRRQPVGADVRSGRPETAGSVVVVRGPSLSEAGQMPHQKGNSSLSVPELKGGVQR